MIGKQSKEGPAERSEKPTNIFPEPYGARGDLVPGVYSFKSADKSAAPDYIGSSEAVGYGHEADVAGVRMGDPFSDPYDYSAEPTGSSPQSGEGVNAPNKPEGAGLEPENSDFY